MTDIEEKDSGSDLAEPNNDEFDEEAYLKANADVAAAVRRGDWSSGRAHYDALGREESRPLGRRRDRLTRKRPSGDQAVEARSNGLQFSVDQVLISKGGGILIIGWINDVGSAVDYIQISAPEWEVCIDGSSLARVRREDVERALGHSLIHPFGFACFLFANESLESHYNYNIELSLVSGEKASLVCPAKHLEDNELRNVLLSYLSEATYFGNKQIALCGVLEKKLGANIIEFNKTITTRLIANPFVERFGQSKPQRPLAGSIIVCLYGKAEYFFLQTALYSGGPGIENYEFIYVLNSPELAEIVLREARNAASIYDLAQTIVVLPGNAGFGAANNVAASFARSDRLLIVNPDVFPFDHDWTKRHSHVLETLPDAQTRLFGAPLYYDDGSLMHGGMYIQSDTGVSLSGGETSLSRLLRIEHYGKGAPPESHAFMRARPVPAVTGAFISVDRRWFEKLGGFSHDYIFGHYEDADLCLKSIEGGIAPWIHPIRMWHLEGKGSTRLPVHDGGSLINRWLFSHTWLQTVSQNLLGPHPTHPLLREPVAPAPGTAPQAPFPTPSTESPAVTRGAPSKPALVRDVYGWSEAQRAQAASTPGRSRA